MNATPSPNFENCMAAAVARRVIEQERCGLLALAEAFGDESPLSKAFAQAVNLIATLNGRVVITGIGKSGHIGRKIQATLSSTGTPALFVHPAEASHGDLGMVTANDAIIALSSSGESSELADILTHSKRFALPLIAVTTRAESTLGRAADIILLMPSVAEACPMGLAPTTSSLMQLALGDALAVALIERRGFTAGDFGTFHPGGRLGAHLRRVRDLMRTDDALPLVRELMPLRDVIVEMTHKALGCVGVVDAGGNRLLGIITDGDLRSALDRDLSTTQAQDIMNIHPLTVRADILGAEALRMMNDRPRPITSLFVLDENGCPEGIVHIHDLLRAGVA
ncbi:MAG: KpsF/GutQ family sugar-phosphate isomerase [Acetobacter sp.]|jgi:arabinose-5-phosphate isomerase|nr:KpsF/GutQ family sugar-phosphate isomerase [Acetobacter sp.]